jgi:hypothetical protein
MSMVTSQRDAALSQAEDYQHQVTLLHDQIQDFKMKVARLTQEKIQWERDCIMMNQQRTTTHHHTMVTPGGTSSSSNTESSDPTMSTTSSTSTTTTVEYYQRKVHDLHGRVQSFQAMMVEKNRQIEELRHQMERNFNQNKWNHMTADHQRHL